MSWVKVWRDDDVIAESDNGLRRVILEPDSDCELDGDYLPILIYRDSYGQTGSAARWSGYHPASETYGDDDTLVRALDYYRARAWQHGSGWLDACLTRYARLFLGATGLVQIDTQDNTLWACDNTALRNLWGSPDSYVFGPDDTREIAAWMEGECYGYVVQERETTDPDEWEDIDSCFGLIGRDWAEQAARDALSN